MAPLLVNNTGRVWLDYHTGGGGTSQEHSIMARYTDGEGIDAASMLEALGDMIVAAGNTSYYDGWAVDGARYSLEGSDISLPTDIPTSVASFLGAGQASATYQSQARESRLVGRGLLTGRRVSLSLYGLVDSLFTSADFRLPRTGGTIADQLLDAVEGSASGLFATIGQDNAGWQSYLNWQYNSYWEGELRS